MIPSRKILLAGAALALLGMTACSSLPKFGNNKAKEAAEADKAGRITMVLSEEAIQPSADWMSTLSTLGRLPMLPAMAT